MKTSWCTCSTVKHYFIFKSQSSNGVQQPFHFMFCIQTWTHSVYSNVNKECFTTIKVGAYQMMLEAT